MASISGLGAATVPDRCLAQAPGSGLPRVPLHRSGEPVVVKTWVVEGKMQGRFSYQCEVCGYCGGNYATQKQAQVYADIHAAMQVPEHR